MISSGKERVTTSQAPRSNLKLTKIIWRSEVDIINIDTHLKSLKRKWIQRLLNSTNPLWNDLMLYGLNLILNSNQNLALFKLKQVLRSNRNKNLQKRIMKMFLFNYLMLGYILPITTSLYPRL